MKSKTISSIITAVGLSGVGIVRVSGELVSFMISIIIGKNIKPRTVNYIYFKKKNGDIMDKGIAIFFKSPYSFTGEDVLELQGHGGGVVLNNILMETLYLGSTLAMPGEFSLRSFLNNKINLIQAQSINKIIGIKSSISSQITSESFYGKFYTTNNP